MVLEVLLELLETQNQFSKLKRAPRDLPRPYPYEVDHAESDFEGPRALGGRFRSILVVFLVFLGT